MLFREGSTILPSGKLLFFFFFFILELWVYFSFCPGSFPTLSRFYWANGFVKMTLAAKKLMKMNKIWARKVRAFRIISNIYIYCNGVYKEDMIKQTQKWWRVWVDNVLRSFFFSYFFSARRICNFVFGDCIFFSFRIWFCYLCL